MLTNFTVTNFPVMIFPPISALAASGKLVLELALLPVTVREYPDPVLPLSGPLTLTVENGRITGFDGPDATAAIAHFDRVGRAVGGDPRVVNSWHAGINPATFYHEPALEDPKRWGNVVFGSPRYAHFHLVGSDPGDICGSVFDPTVILDDEVIWDRGRLAFLDRPEIVALADRHGVDLRTLAVPQPIGV